MDEQERKKFYQLFKEAKVLIGAANKINFNCKSLNSICHKESVFHAVNGKMAFFSHLSLSTFCQK